MGFWQQRKQELAGEDVKEKLSSFLLLSVIQLSVAPAAAKNISMTIAIVQNLLNIDSTEFKLRKASIVIKVCWMCLEYSVVLNY